MTREETKHIVDVAFDVPLAVRRIGEDRTYLEDEIKEAKDMAIKALEQEPRWIPVSERLPTKEEYIDNNGLFIVSDGNRTYAEYFDVYNSMKYFGEPTMNGFRVDRCVTAWMPLPKPYADKAVEE
jgi:predicted RNase H-like HicB family nuclease